MTARNLMLTGTAVRGVYGLASLFTPDLLFKLSGKPAEAEPRYFNALFGGRDLTIVGLTLLALRDGRTKEAVYLNMSCEATDLVSLLQELRARGGIDQTTAAGIAFNVFGWSTWVTALRTL